SLSRGGHDAPHSHWTPPAAPAPVLAVGEPVTLPVQAAQVIPADMCQGLGAFWCPQHPQSLQASSASRALDQELLELQALIKQERGKDEELMSQTQRTLLAQEVMAQEQEELQRRQNRCKELEVEMALQKKDLQHAQEWQKLQQQRHAAELRHQAEVLELKYEANSLAEQEAWQQMEALLHTTQRKQADRAQELEMQDLAASVETERFLSTELRAQCEKTQSSHSSKLRQVKDLNARLAGHELEILALESAATQRDSVCIQQELHLRQQLYTEQASYRTECESLEASVEVLRNAEERARQALQEASTSRARELSLEQRLEQLQAQVEALEALKARPPPEPTPPPQPAVDASDYVASAPSDELDRSLEAEIRSLGVGCLKGNVLTRTGPKKYKLGDQKVFMQLSEGAGVAVRVGGGYIPLANWVRELTAPGDKGSDDPFQALDASSPFAAV
ncbi:unnamed protein product, partial [Symbiodinium pilosum]